MRLLAGLLLLLCPLLPALAALTPEDQPLALAVVQYGQDHVDQGTGLIRDASGVPSVAESSIGLAAAALLLGQEVELGRGVLDKLLDYQQPDGPEMGQFPWQGSTAAKPSADAMLYMAPLLATIYREAHSQLSEALALKLKTGLERVWTALGRLALEPSADSRFLLRAAAVATVGAALGNEGPSLAVKEASAWLGLVRASGLPAGHSPTLDAARLTSLKWVYEVAPEALRPALQPALMLCAVDLALRLHPTLPGVAGAQQAAVPADYLGSLGFTAYTLYTDFGHPRPAAGDPYIMAVLLPRWRAPESLRKILDEPLPRTLRTLGPRGPVPQTTTYLGPGFSLGTMCGEVGGGTIPLFASFSGQAARSTLYAYCSPAPCHVQTVQDQSLALASFNFDNLGQGKRRQAWVRLVLGRPQDVEEVIAYGQPWNDQPTSLGERESLALSMHGCYVGITLTRVGPAASQEGTPAKPASLRWAGSQRQGDLSLLIYARQADYALPRPVHDVRAGLVLEIAPRAAYPDLAAFAKHLEQTRLKQTGRTYKERQTQKEKPREPGVMMPYPTAKVDLVYRSFVEQTLEYVNGPRSLKLVEDLLSEELLRAFVNGQELKPQRLWDAALFALEPGGDLTAALQPLGAL